MRKSRWMLLAVIAVILFVCTAGASSCGSGSGGQVQVTKNETREIAAQVLELERAEPVARPKDSAELRTQNAYYTADADPDKLWYVTLIALDGTPYMHFTVRGAPAPAGDEVTNPEQLFCQHFSDQRPDG